MKKIIVINGFPEAGKDEFIKSFALSCPYEVENYSTVEKYKKLLKSWGWTGDKSPEIRKALSELKRIDKELFDGPFQELRHFIYKYCDLRFNDYVLFIHCREPEEIERIKYAFSAISLLIVRKDQETYLFSNSSDEGVVHHKYDSIIFNDGTKNFIEKAFLFQQMIIEEEIHPGIRDSFAGQVIRQKLGLL